MSTFESTRNSMKMCGMPPFTDRVFDKQEVNRCCSGVPLTEPSSELLSALEKVRAYSMGEEANTDWRERSLNDIVKYILEKLHRPIGIHLLNLETLIDMVTETHGDEIGDLMSRIRDGFTSLRGMLLAHFLHEEDVLFPWILSGKGNSAGAVIDAMRMQHMKIAAKTKFVATSASQLPRSTIPCLGQQVLYITVKEIESEISHHVHMENNILYPRALGEEGRYASSP